MTDGGLTGEGVWQDLGYIPYDLLHRQWQTQVLTMIERRLPGNAKAQTIVAEVRRRYPKGFAQPRLDGVAHLQGDVLPRMSQLTRYIVKYVVSPPMALSRIIRYDPERGEVTYWYRDHLSRGKKTETVSRETFIGRMVQHPVQDRDGTGYLTQRLSAHPVLRAASDLHVEESAGPVEGGVARGGTVGVAGGRVCEAADLPGADESRVGP